LICNFLNKFTVNQGKFNMNDIKDVNEMMELIKDRTKITQEEIQKQYSELKYNNTMLNDMVNDFKSKNDQYETNLKKMKCEYNNIINKKRKFINISKEKTEEETDENLCFICCDYDVSKRLNCCGKKICGICVCDISRKSNLCPYCRKQNMEDNVVELNNIIEI